MRILYRIACTTALAAALGTASVAAAHVHVPGLDINGQCVGDQDSDDVVAINELILAVNNSLGSCPNRPVEIQFKGAVGHDEFACGTAYSGIGTADSQLLPSDFRLYVSQVHLLELGGAEVPVQLDQDGIWQHDDVALLDFENGSGPCNAFGNEATNTTIRGMVPAGVYTGIKFTLGVPFDLNHGNASTAPAPLNFTAMFWNWQAGYKFLRVDNASGAFQFLHLGSTGCESGGPSQPPSVCASPNRPTVEITGFNPDHSVIVADLKTLLAGNDLSTNAGGAPGCMSDSNDPECAAVFAALGLTFPGGQPTSGQTFFYLDAHSDGPSDHKEVVIAASSAEAGSALVLHPEFETGEAIPLSLADCLGGTGDDCEGGTLLYTSVNPGLSAIGESEADESLYTLADATTVTLEVTAIAEGFSLRLGETVADGVGDTIELGTTPDFHADLEAQLALPGGGEVSGTYAVSFKVSGNGYTESEPLTISFAPGGGGGGGHGHGE